MLQENLSLGFPTGRDSYQPAQQLKLANMLNVQIQKLDGSYYMQQKK